MTQSDRLKLKHGNINIDVPMIIKNGKNDRWYGYCSYFSVKVYGDSEDDVVDKIEEAVLHRLNATDRKAKKNKKESE